jgi:hypothetical protein
MRALNIASLKSCQVDAVRVRRRVRQGLLPEELIATSSTIVWRSLTAARVSDSRGTKVASGEVKAALPTRVKSAG